jgi:hypothetical protein
MRKIALLTPVKGDLPMTYHRNITRILTSRLGVGIANILVEGIGVQWARDTAVYRAKQLDCREVVFIDKDLDVPLEAFERLLSYEHEAIVCGTYSHRNTNSFFLGKRWPEDDATDEKHPRGLWRMYQAAVGFCKIRMSVFDKIAALNPDRRGIMGETHGTVEIDEAFPMELIGANTPAGRLKRIAKILASESAPLGKLTEINLAMQATSEEPNLFLSEDYGFCRLAREAGIKILMDPELMVQHEAKIKVPIATMELQAMLAEPWRGLANTVAAANLATITPFPTA